MDVNAMFAGPLSEWIVCIYLVNAIYVHLVNSGGVY